MNHHDLQLIEIGEKAGAEKERATIVAWLRNTDWFEDKGWPKALARSIEAGEHLKGKR